MKNLQKNILNQNGFTYLMALILIMIMGIMLGAVGQSWQTIMKREKEAELLFRGSQIKDAIKQWNTAKQVKMQLNDLKQLLEDPRTPEKARYLRRLYTDPITEKEWVIILGPNKDIIGVASSSQDTPLKVDNFPDDLKDLAGKQKYSDWKFIYVHGQPTVTPPQAQQKGDRP